MPTDEATINTFANLLAHGDIDFTTLIEEGFDEIAMEIMVKRSIRYKTEKDSSTAVTNTTNSSYASSETTENSNFVIKKRNPNLTTKRMMHDFEEDEEEESENEQEQKQEKMSRTNKDGNFNFSSTTSIKQDCVAKSTNLMSEDASSSSSSPPEKSSSSNNHSDNSGDVGVAPHDQRLRKIHRFE